MIKYLLEKEFKDWVLPRMLLVFPCIILAGVALGPQTSKSKI